VGKATGGAGAIFVAWVILLPCWLLVRETVLFQCVIGAYLGHKKNPLGRLQVQEYFTVGIYSHLLSAAGIVVALRATDFCTNKRLDLDLT
jgi:hypothetical protein